jgi:AcrR family transcriptional regulator
MRATQRRKVQPAGADGEESAEKAAIRESEWIDAARRLLIAEGIAAVKIGRLARELGVTRGGFYWRFRDRADLLRALLEDWRVRNSAAMVAALDGPGTPAARMKALIDVWIDEKGFDPAYDTAVRGWARGAPKVLAAVRRVDDERIAAFRHVFEDAGYRGEEALIRARVTYYHQVGYYAMGIEESRARRRSLSPFYYEVLTGWRYED